MDAIDRKILDALQEDARLSNVDLAARVAARRFRQDLFYRLNVIELRMPSLRERREDIPVLALFFYPARGLVLSYTIIHETRFLLWENGLLTPFWSK
mgnify:CR=1 FL=1